MKKIMIVEDEPSTVKLLKILLKKNNYEVSSYINGKKAVEAVEKERPDLILMDIMMPEMDGIEAIGKIKKLQSNKKIPIIILSSLEHEIEVNRGLDAGAMGYVVKPFDTKKLLREIEKNLS
ncbi:MAG: response regulator [Elusimicrobiota bacterium]